MPPGSPTLTSTAATSPPYNLAMKLPEHKPAGKICTSPTAGPNLSLLAFPGFALVGRVIDSRLIGEPWIPLPSSRILAGFNQLLLKGRLRRRLYSNPAWRLCSPEGAVECGSGREVTGEITGTQSDQHGSVSNNWKPDVGTRRQQEAGDKLGSHL